MKEEWSIPGIHCVRIPTAALFSAALFSPLVYKVYFRGALVYVGMSAVGLVRISSRNHRWSHLLEHKDTEIKVSWFETEDQARAAETLLIMMNKPPLNIKGVGDQDVREAPKVLKAKV